jgi:heme exporter protein D
VSSLHEFLSMGGYAAYVWPAYALFFAILIADSLAPSLRRRRILHELRTRLARHAARAARAASSPSNPSSP